MENGKVIDARDRFERLERSRDTGIARNVRYVVEEALDKLRSTGRIDQGDRAKLARKLGEAATKLNPHSPKKGAALIICRADGDSSSLRPDRFFIYEGGREPETLAATGATWARLIEAAARLQSEATGQEGTGRDSRNRNNIRRILGGTSLLPHSATDSTQKNKVVELLEDAAKYIVKRIERETRITELWRNLNDSPFAIHQLNENQENPPGPVPHASSLARKVRLFDNYELDDRCYFGDIGDVEANTNWSKPTLRIGYLSKIVRIPAFCIPKDFVEKFNKDSENQEAWDSLTDFFESNTGTYNKLPNVIFSQKEGFGFLDCDFQFIIPIVASVNADNTNRVCITIRSENHPLPTGFLINDKPLTEYDLIDKFYQDLDGKFTLDPYGTDFWMTKYKYNDKFTRDSSVILYSEHNKNIDYESKDFLDYQYHTLIMNDIEFSEFDSFQEWKDDERYAALFGQDDFIFTPAFDCGSLTAPARKNSIAGSIFSSIKSKENDSIDNALVQKAEIIAECGLNYIDAWSDYIKDGM